MDIDRQTDEAIEMVSQGARLTTNLIQFIFKSLADKLEKNGEKALIDSQSKEGKQKINNLLRKHKDGIQSLDENLTKEQVKDYQKELKKLGVDFSIVKNEKDNYSFFFAGGQADLIEKALKNVVELKSKVQNNDKVKDAQLELNSEMKDSSEKEIENANKAYSDYISRTENDDIPERENLNENEKELFDKIKSLDETEKEVQKEVKKEMQLESKTIAENKEEISDVIDKRIETLIDNEPETNEINQVESLNDLKEKVHNIDSLDNLSNEDKEQIQDTIEKRIEGLQEKEKSNINNLNAENQQEELPEKEIEQLENNNKEIKNEVKSLQDLKEKVPVNVESENTIDTKENSKELLNDKLSQLNEQELELFEKRIEYENIATAPVFNESETYKLANELSELQSNHSKETVNKINNLDKDFRNLDNSSEISDGNKLNANEILRETKKRSPEKNKEKSNQKENVYSIENIKNIDKKIKEESKDKSKVKEKEQSL